MSNSAPFTNDPFYGPGVVAANPSSILASTKAAVAAVLADIPADKHAAIVGVATRDGLNLAFAYRVGDRLEVGAWVGKSGWDAPLEAGVMLKAVF